MAYSTVHPKILPSREKEQEPRSVGRGYRGLKITREGRYYIGLTLGVGIAATNTGNNLLFLVLGLLLALIIVSGLLSEAALRNLEVRRFSAASYRAGEPTLYRVQVRNSNKYLPSIGLEIQEVEAGDFESVAGRCLRVNPGGFGSARIRIRPERRGELYLKGLKVSTKYPFGIFAKTRIFDLPSKVLSWPARVSGRARSIWRGSEESGPPVSLRNGVEDLRGLRLFRDGDESRLVHWKRSLRVGEMLIVERDAPDGRRVVIRLSPGVGALFEDAVSVAAGKVEEHLMLGDEVALDAPSGFSAPYGRGTGHLRRILALLALVPPSREDESEIGSSI